MSGHITAGDLTKVLASPTPPHLLDVREVDEHTFVSLTGSKLVPLGQLVERADEIAPWRDEPVVVYCHHGMRSQHAIALLRRLGFTQLTNLTGGIDAWALEVDATMRRY